jgi:hypothetical protein
MCLDDVRGVRATSTGMRKQAFIAHGFARGLRGARGQRHLTEQGRGVGARGGLISRRAFRCRGDEDGLRLLSRRRYVNRAFLVAGDAQSVVGAELEDELDFIIEIFRERLTGPGQIALRGVVIKPAGVCIRFGRGRELLVRVTALRSSLDHRLGYSLRVFLIVS